MHCLSVLPAFPLLFPPSPLAPVTSDPGSAPLICSAISGQLPKPHVRIPDRRRRSSSAVHILFGSSITRNLDGGSVCFLIEVLPELAIAVGLSEGKVTGGSSSPVPFDSSLMSSFSCSTLASEVLNDDSTCIASSDASASDFVALSISFTLAWASVSPACFSELFSSTAATAPSTSIGLESVFKAEAIGGFSVLSPPLSATFSSISMTAESFAWSRVLFSSSSRGLTTFSSGKTDDPTAGFSCFVAALSLSSSFFFVFFFLPPSLSLSKISKVSTSLTPLNDGNILYRVLSATIYPWCGSWRKYGTQIPPI